MQMSNGSYYKNLGNKELKIPGLIQGKKSESDKLLSEAELERERLEFAASQKTAELRNKALAATIHAQANSRSVKQELTPAQASALYGQSYPGTSATQPYELGNGYFDIDKLNQPAPLDLLKKYWEDSKVYGPSPSRQVNPFKDAEYFQQEILKKLKPQKTAFEEMIDLVFSAAEKEQFLIDIGYTLERDKQDDNPIIRRKMSDGSMKLITNTLNDLFLKEITVKFKNLLLAKATLKLRLPDVQVQDKREEAIT
jgi:hypothetical protein